jgi:uncharacterized protein
MNFEFDEDKSTSNREKHGIDFVEAQALWEDPDLLEIPAITRGEPRQAVIGRIGLNVWTAIITRRDDALRIISVRRAHEKEARYYHDRRI